MSVRHPRFIGPAGADRALLLLAFLVLFGCEATPRANDDARRISGHGDEEAAPPDDADARRPNVLFLIADDLTAEALGAYGCDEARTPAIDALAARGVRFDRACCQFPVCGASRAAIMSGMYPPSLGVMGNGEADRFAERLGARPALAEHFKTAGYHTARVSKIFHMRVPGDITAGVDGPDHAASWTERHNCRGPEWMTPGSREHLSKEKLNFEPDRHYGLGFGTAFYVVRGEGDGAEQPDAQAATRAIEILRRRREEPFFLAVGFVRPHVPLVAPDRWHRAFPPGDMPLAAESAGDGDDIPSLGRSYDSARAGLVDPDRQRRVLSAYHAATSFVDHQVGRILRALDELGLRESTVVVFSSDHGYHLGEHGFWQKMSLHEESARIPLIIAAPDVVPGATPRLAQQIDLYPTLAELAGLGIPTHVQGRSLVPILRDPSHATRVHDAVYCFKKTGTLLRSESHAYLAWRDGSAELYDMRRDPRQFRNLAGDEAHASTEAAYRSRLAEFLRALPR